MTNHEIRDYLARLELASEVFRRAWDAIAIYDLAGRLVAGNAAVRALVGETLAAELPGQHFTAHLALEEATKMARAFAQVVTSGEPFDGETIFRESDGSPVPVRTRLVPARLDGRIVGVVGFARDVRAQRSAESQFVRAEQQFRSLFENHPDALTIHDLQGRFIRVNAGAERLTGYHVDEMIGQTPALLSPTGVWDEDRRMRDALAAGTTVEYTHTIVTKKREFREVTVRGVPLTTDGEVRGFSVIAHDVSEERRRDRESSRDAKRIADLYAIAATPNLSSDEKVEGALAAGLRELQAEWGYVGCFHDEIMELTHTAGLGVGSFDVGTTIEIERAVVRHALAAKDLFVAEDLSLPPWRDDAAGSRSVWRSFAGAPLSVDGQSWGAIGFTTSSRMMRLSPTDRDYVRAIAALVASAVQQSLREKRLDLLAFHDPLTGLPNRALLQDRLEQTLLSARRHRRSFAAHYIDIDHFKQINDTYGHQIGDGVLVAVANWLRASLRDSDTIARIGGDEFVVLQPEIDSQHQAEELALKLVGIRHASFAFGPHEIRVTVSVGGAVFPADAENPVDMLRAADAALYAVKNRGRNGFSVGTVR